MNVLVLAPHPDDETIGCGGTLCLHADQGDQVGVVFLTSGELGLRHLPREKAWAIRETEAKAAAQILRVSELTFLRCSDWTLGKECEKAAALLEPVLRQKKPEIIYLPHPGDAHPDHRVCLPILLSALSKITESSKLRLYEIWTPLSEFHFVQDITPLMERKLRSLRAHQSQLQDFDYIRAVTGLNQYRGALAAKSEFAEVFAEMPHS